MDDETMQQMTRLIKKDIERLRDMLKYQNEALSDIEATVDFMSEHITKKESDYLKESIDKKLGN